MGKSVTYDYALNKMFFEEGVARPFLQITFKLASLIFVIKHEITFNMPWRIFT